MSAKDKEALRNLLLTRADLSYSWVASANDPTSTEDQALIDAATAKAEESCPSTIPDEVAEEESDDFEYEDITISSSASLYSSEADALANLKAVDSSSGLECLRKILVAVLESGWTKEGIRVVDVLPEVEKNDPDLAVVENRVVTMTITAEARGNQVDITMALIMLARGPVVSTLTLVAPSESSHIDAAAEDIYGAVTTMANRLKGFASV